MFKLKAQNGANNITGERLAQIRHDKNISQRQLAKMMQLSGYDVDHHFIRRIENRERFVTDIVILLKKWRSIVQTKRFEKQHK